GGEGSIDSVTVEEGESVSAPDMSGVLAPDGYEFSYWADENGAEYDFSTLVTSDITLTAQWVKVAEEIFVVYDDVITGLTDYGKTLTNVQIPVSIDGVEITAIFANAFKDNKVIKTLTFESGSKVTSIGSNAFDNSTLENIHVPASITSLDITLFNYNDGSSCGSIKNFMVDEDNENYSSIDGNLYNKDKTVLLAYALGKDDRTFALPDSVKEIGDYSCFSAKFSNIEFGENSSLEAIGEYAFQWASLESVTIPASVKTIECCAFDTNSGLTSVTFEENSTLKTIGSSAFFACQALTEIDLPDSLEKIEYGAFLGCGFTSITIPKSVIYMDNNIFEECNSLVKIYCNVSSKPEGWYEDWNLGCNAIVVWLSAYTVNFDLNGGEGSIDSVTVEEGESVSAPDMSGVSAPDGYEFSYWVDENGDEYDFSTPVTSDITLTAEWVKIVTYTVTLDWNGARNHNQWYIFAAPGEKITAPSLDVDGIVLPGELDGWYTNEGVEFDFDNDVVTKNMTLTAKWITDDISKKVFDAYTTATGKMSFGNSLPADISDGSTLNIEFDVIAANMPKQNYNLFVMLGADNNHYNQSGRFFTFQYANWAYFDPWPGHYVTANNKTATGVDNGTGWDPTQMIVKDQSVKFSYTAPTETTTGALKVYVKHMSYSDSEYTLLASTTNLTLANVQDTSNVFMGFVLDSNSNALGWTFTGYRSWVDRVGGGVEENYGFNSATNADADVVENTTMDIPTFVTWEEGKRLNIRANTDVAVDTAGSFQMWYGNMQGVDLAPGEILTWEFTVDSVEYGLWYSVWGGVSVVSGAFPTSLPQSYTKTVGFYGNFALDTSSHDGRYATICGDVDYYEYCEFEEGYSNFDPYRDVCNYGGEPLNIKIEYTAPDFDNMIDGSLVYYKKVASSEDWIKVTSVLYPDLYEDLHIVIWYYSSQNKGGAYDFIMSDYKMYTSEGQDLNRVISAGGICQVKEYVE
ncbi:MAG: leucine-rich repeat protein, partial [Clostridia bacterium]|nr:leucine-rich repeat protein [Clostridia bacterium]